MTDAGLYHDTCHHRIYNLTCEQFDDLRDYAKACCQICSLPEGETARGRLVIDHLGDYGSHAVRGLLCDKCNSLMSRVDRRVITNPADRGLQLPAQLLLCAEAQPARPWR